MYIFFWISFHLFFHRKEMFVSKQNVCLLISQIAPGNTDELDYFDQVDDTAFITKEKEDYLDVASL